MSSKWKSRHQEKKRDNLLGKSPIIQKKQESSVKKKEIDEERLKELRSRLQAFGLTKAEEIEYLELSKQKFDSVTIEKMEELKKKKRNRHYK